MEYSKRKPEPDGKLFRDIPALSAWWAYPREVADSLLVPTIWKAGVVRGYRSKADAEIMKMAEIMEMTGIPKNDGTFRFPTIKSAGKKTEIVGPPQSRVGPLGKAASKELFQWEGTTMFHGVLASLLLASFVAAGATGGETPPRPNILFILADDYGLDGVGCYGSDRFQTPNLDRLAREGIRFENCYCTPLCGPTRCLLITGRYAFRTGGLTNQTAGLPSPKEEPSIAQILKQAGYVTGMCGKWRQMGGTPGDWGFEEYLTDPTAGGYFWEKSYIKNGEIIELAEVAYYPDIAHEFALDFIRRHKDRPFFFYYSSHLVHGPILPTPDSPVGPEGRPPQGIKGGPGPNQPYYADNVAYLDKQVGSLVAELERLGLREKTLIVFSSDNGTAVESGTIGGRRIHGQKGTMWEGGAHVPLIVSWKGTTPEGKVLKDLVDFSDFLPTFAELAGAKLPEGIIFDGHSFAPQLRGEQGNPREWIFVQLGNRWYVRDMGWKLNESGELYDMSDAPFEEKLVPVEGQSPEAAAARARLQAVLSSLNPAGGKQVPPGVPARPRARQRQARPATSSS